MIQLNIAVLHAIRTDKVENEEVFNMYNEFCGYE